MCSEALAVHVKQHENTTKQELLTLSEHMGSPDF
jgi:hypothetical protein